MRLSDDRRHGTNVKERPGSLHVTNCLNTCILICREIELKAYVRCNVKYNLLKENTVESGDMTIYSYRDVKPRIN